MMPPTSNLHSQHSAHQKFAFMVPCRSSSFHTKSHLLHKININQCLKLPKAHESQSNNSLYIVFFNLYMWETQEFGVLAHLLPSPLHPPLHFSYTYFLISSLTLTFCFFSQWNCQSICRFPAPGNLHTD